MTDHLRGHKIRQRSDGQFVYCDNGELIAYTWMNRPCGHCGKDNTKEGHDGCLGTLPNVMNACCGHGNINEAYVQYWDGTVVSGKEAIEIMEQGDREDGNERTDEHIERLEQQNKIYRKYLEKIADVENGFDPLAVEARMAIEEVGALESDCIHCNGKGFNGLDWCTQCNQGEVLE